MQKLKKRSYLNVLTTYTIIISILVLITSCKPMYNTTYTKPNLVEKKPTRTLKKLHKKLFYTSKQGFAIGHQDATFYGVGWEEDDYPNITKSDLHDVANDYPAVYGFDISGIEIGNQKNIDSVPFESIKNTIIETYKKGGIITISWHANNPKTNGDSWDTTPAVIDIIGNGKLAAKFDSWLDNIAVFLKTLKYRSKPIPILFRPYHEMNGKWFWWGSPNCSSLNYIQLWRKTVYSLRDNHKLNNLLYVYSPNKLNPNEDYMEWYPGDNFVDILGIDIYDFNNSNDYITSVKNDLKTVKDIALSKNKLFAFTETGLEKVSTPNWFTEILYPNIKNSGISWVLFWRNHTKSHHYLPYKGHPNEEDFKIFKSQPKTLFLKDINKIKP
jgi:mannan endo-1,4-beta-mannosidase